MNKFLEEERKQRLKNIQRIITESQADACIITSAVNQFYLCNRVFDGFLYIEPEGNPTQFIKRPIGASEENVIYIRKPEQITEYLSKKPTHVLLEADVLSYNATLRLQNALKASKLTNISGTMRQLRSIKSAYEIEEMKECANIHSEVYSKIPALYRKGMTDLELQIEIEHQMRLRGSIGLFRAFGNNMDVFMGTILAGNNAQSASPFDFALGGGGASPLLPLGANGTTLTKGTTFMVDMAGNYRPTMTDMSRAFAVEAVPDLAFKAHQVSQDIHAAIQDVAKPETLCADLYFLAEKIVEQNNLQAYFMGTHQKAKFIGHGLGLEINEPPVLAPRSKETLKGGMAIAIEPKFVLPDIGAVGIENTYIVTENGLEKITLCEESLIVL